MITNLEAAAMAAHVYGNLDTVVGEQSTLPVPEGWSSDMASNLKVLQLIEPTALVDGRPTRRRS